MRRVFHQPAAPRGATRRELRASEDAGLNRVLDVMVTIALIVGGVALITRLF